jgi:tetratricopeptide (TPR) repeat protein
MNINLRPSTIIPPKLYVERAADRQLREIIHSMGRPGYVLVARQMGKTNLLLNARRELETSDLLFVYIDLSNRVESLETYFGLVLSTAFSVHPGLLEASGLQGEVPQSASSYEFESILRKIHHVYPGRLVFVLYEIDSLASYPFSDRIFAQIRSMYFSRSNFPEYSRVTYVLSGVAEPGDLIKDKNISPFNIGEKIYLSDFTSAEFDLFVKKAELGLSQNVRDRVFYWTRGNPRMTWDICAEIEKTLERSDSPLSDQAIDAMVSQLYLTSFDKPPIDHIRTLAETDKEIRQAIASIRSENASAISDRVKNKLYLAGVTNFQTSVNEGITLSIKNPIVDKALSERWLNDLERDSQSLLLQARNNFEEKVFQTTVALFEQYLNDHDFDRSSLDAYRLGVSYFSLQKYPKAVEWLSSYVQGSPADTDALKASAHVLLGRASIAIGAYDQAIINLKAGMELGAKSTAAFAKAFLAWTLLEVDRFGNADEAEKLSNEALVDITTGDSEERATIRVRALTNLSEVKEAQGNKEEAIELVETALQENSRGYRPILLVRQLKLLTSGRRKEELLSELAPSVMALRSTPAEERADGALRQIALPAMMYLGLNGRDDDFDKLLSYLRDAGEFEAAELPRVFHALHTLCREYGEKGGEVFLRGMVTRFANVQAAEQDVLGALRLLITAEEFSFTDQYLQILSRNESVTWLVSMDLIALEFILSRQRTNRPAVATLDRVISMARENIDDRGINYVFLSYYEMARLEELGRIDKALNIADELLILFADAGDPLASWSKRSRETVLEGAKTLIRKYSVQRPVRNQHRSVGRNTKVTVAYKDGRRLEAKFKQVQQDIALGLCEIQEV